MNTEIYLTVRSNSTRLVITGELALLREFMAAVADTPGAPTIYNPAPVTDQTLTMQGR